MHRYEELERLYYRKRIIKAVFVFIIAIAVAAGFYLFSKKPEKHKAETNTTKPKSVKKEKKHIEKNQTKNEKKIEVKPNKTDKNQTLTFILPEIDEKMIEKEKPSKPKKPKKEEKKPKILKKQPEIKKTPVIVEKRVSINELINKFNMNPTYDLAMVIAKEYFNRGDLNNARIWVIKANSINPEDVESWLLFADILVKKNEKQKALKILNVYIDTYGNNPLIEAKIRSINE